MGRTIRAFVAVEASPGPALREVLGKLSRFGPAVRPVAAGELHLTVKFLGETPEETVAPLATAVCEAIRGHAASRHELRGLGAFPHLQRPSVVWAGVTCPEPLITLAGLVEESCAGLGFPVEPRPFHAHLTLARVKARPPASLADLVQDSESRTFGALEVQKLTLFQSDLQKSGPRYTALAHWPLSDSGEE